MKSTIRWTAKMVVALGLAQSLAGHAYAGSHLWEINEIFSNASGTIQFIELKVPTAAPSEHNLGGHELISVGTGHIFVVPANLTGNTSFRHLLFATSGFAALPGAPTPNYIIQDGFFLPGGDTIDWEPNLNYDTFTFGPGELPTDGVNSIQITDYNLDTFVTGVNSPTNYAGDSGSVIAGPPVPAISTIGILSVALLVMSAGVLISRRRSTVTA